MSRFSSSAILTPAWTRLLIKRLEHVRRLRRGSFDIVHNNGILYDSGVRAAKRAGIPCVCHVREYAQPENGIEFCDESRVRGSLRMADRVIFISSGVSNRFEGWCNPYKSTVMFNGFDVKRYHREHAQLFRGGCCRMLLAGHIMPTKGQLEAVRRMREVAARGQMYALETFDSNRYVDGLFAIYQELLASREG